LEVYWLPLILGALLRIDLLYAWAIFVSRTFAEAPITILIAVLREPIQATQTMLQPSKYVKSKMTIPIMWYLDTTLSQAVVVVRYT